MAYTPINWQTGDTITAEKLNRCDNGWVVESTQLFSETVTTVEVSSSIYAAELTYSQFIDADTITVTFDGTDYECNRIDAFGAYFYGGFNEGPDFTEYPFYIEVSSSENTIYSETASTHTVVVSAMTMQTSAGFTGAVLATIGGAFYQVTSGVTTWQEIADAIGAGKIVYRYFYYEADECAEYELITCADTDGKGTYRIHYVVAKSAGVYTDTVSAASADSPLYF